MAKFIAFLSTACLIGVLIGIIAYLWLFGRGDTRRLLDSGSVVTEVRQLRELVTVKYSIEKVVGMKEERSPVGTESILLLVQGKVLAGVDLAELKPDDVSVSKDTVRIRLTPPHIQAAYLDEKFTKVWDRSITWWTPWVTPDPDLEHRARMHAIDDIKSAAIQMGILTEARKNTETAIQKILDAFAMGKIVFVYGT